MALDHIMSSFPGKKIHIKIRPEIIGLLSASGGSFSISPEHVTSSCFSRNGNKSGFHFQMLDLEIGPELLGNDAVCTRTHTTNMTTIVFCQAHFTSCPVYNRY